MIRYVDITTDGCSRLGDIQACLDYPKCGYHDDDSILIAGWVLPSSPLSDNVHIIVRIEENQQHHDISIDRVARPDVFKAKLPNLQYPIKAMQVGFSARIPFSRSVTASLIIVKNGEESLWCKLNIVVEDALTSFVNKLTQRAEGPASTITTDTIVSNTKIYYPHTFQQTHISVIHTHLNSLRNAVSTDEFIVSLYQVKNGFVSCQKSSLNFEICSSRTLNDHVFLFCRDENGVLFIIHQHVTSIDGVYYPSCGIYYNFCHVSQNFLAKIIEFLLEEKDYFKPGKYKKTAFIIGHSRPYHFMYDGMLGLENISQKIDEIDGITPFYTLENSAFIDATKVFNRKLSTNIINIKSLITLEQEGVLFIKIGSLFGNNAKNPVVYEKIKSLDDKITAYARDVNSHSENIASEIKKHFPIIWIGVTGQKRAWLEQIEGYSNIINKLYQSFPGMAVVFDGWTSSLASLERDEIESDKDRKITHEIIQRIAPDIKMFDLVGATIDKKIYIGTFVDCAIVNYSTGSMNVSRFCGRPCVTHMNNSFAPALNNHVHKNAYPIPDEYVTDVMGDGNTIDSTSYHIDWEHIYDALVSHLGQQNIINNRS